MAGNKTVTFRICSASATRCATCGDSLLNRANNSENMRGKANWGKNIILLLWDESSPLPHIDGHTLLLDGAIQLLQAILKHGEDMGGHHPSGEGASILISSEYPRRLLR